MAKDFDMVDMSQIAAAAANRELLSLPHEVLQHVLQYSAPTDLAQLSKSCHALDTFISDNDLLWRSVYCSHFVSLEATCQTRHLYLTTS